jgi:hypothetical protein
MLGIDRTKTFAAASSALVHPLMQIANCSRAAVGGLRFDAVVGGMGRRGCACRWDVGLRGVGLPLPYGRGSEGVGRVAGRENNVAGRRLGGGVRQGRLCRLFT